MSQRLHCLLSINFSYFDFLLSRTSGPNRTKVGCDTPWMVLFQNYDWWWLPLCFRLVEKLEILENNFYTTFWLNKTKFSPNTPWVVHFKSYVCLLRQLSKMAAMVDYLIFGLSKMAAMVDYLIFGFPALS